MGDAQLQTVECDLVMQNETLAFAVRWMEPYNPMLSEVSQRQEDEHSMFSSLYGGFKEST